MTLVKLLAALAAAVAFIVGWVGSEINPPTDPLVVQPAYLSGYPPNEPPVYETEMPYATPMLDCSHRQKTYGQARICQTQTAVRTPGPDKSGFTREGDQMSYVFDGEWY